MGTTTYVLPLKEDSAHGMYAAVQAAEYRLGISAVANRLLYAVDALPAIYLMWHIDSNIANEPSCRGDGAAERAYTSLVTSILQYNHATSFDLDIEVLIGHSDQSKSDGLAGGKHRDSAADAAAKARPAIAQRSDEKKVGNFAKADPHKPEPFPPLVRKWRKFSNPKRKARREAHHAEGPALCTYCKSMRHTYKTCVGLKQDKCNNTTEHKDMYKWDLHKSPRKDIHADGAMWQRPTRPRGESRQGGQCNAPPALATTNGNSDAQRPVELGPSSTAASLTSLDVNEDGRPAPNAQPPPPLPGSNAATTASANPPADPLCHAALRTVQEWRKLLHAQPEPSQGIQVMGLTMSHELFCGGRATMDAAMRQSRMPMSIVGWHSAAECACLPLTPWDGDIVEAGVRAYLQPMIMEFIKRGTVPAKAPTHFDKIQTGFIDEADPRRELRGQECLRTTDYVPRGTVLGPLAGSLLTLEEHHAWKYSADLPPGMERCWWDAVHAAYALELDSPDIKRAFPYCANAPLVLSMAREANRMALINDPTISPFAYGPPAAVSPPNVAPLVVSFLGLPIVLVVVICDIAPYQELLYCYGHGYWDKLRERLRAAQVAGAP
eukprot:jgi/Tetstr1/443821/TSEL_003275.t1